MNGISERSFSERLKIFITREVRSNVPNADAQDDCFVQT